MPSVADYEYALRALPFPSPGLRAMLIAHCRAFDRTTTAGKLATAAGYRDWRVVNLQYHRLGHQVGLRLGLGGGNIAVFTRFLEPTPPCTHWKISMREEFAIALTRANWVPAKRRRRLENLDERLRWLRERVAVADAYKMDLIRRRRLLIRLKAFDAEIVARAFYCLGSHEGAALWLTRPQRGLKGRVPVELKMIPIRKAEILHLLGQIEHGVF